MPYSRYIFGSIPWYSVLILLGMIIAIVLAVREEKRVGFPKDTVVDLCLFMLPAGIIGARLYYVVFAWDEFASNPVSALYIWNGGLAIYGGIIAGLITAVIFAHCRHINTLKLLDIVIPGVILAQGIGRWGNFFNMEAYGLPIMNSAFQFFPVAVLIPENGTEIWHMATFFYESCWDVASFLVLWLNRKNVHKDGDVFFGYALLYGCGRFVVEGLRMDSLMSFSGSFRVSQWLAVACAVLVSFLLLYRIIKESRLYEKIGGRLTKYIFFPVAVAAACLAFAFDKSDMIPILAAYVVWFESLLAGIWCHKKSSWITLLLCGAGLVSLWFSARISMTGWIQTTAECAAVSLLLLSSTFVNYSTERQILNAHN